jgi:hypothetical protein
MRARRAGQVLMLTWFIAEQALDEDEQIEQPYSPDGVDLTLVRWMLSLTPAQRLDVLEDCVTFVMEARARNP